MLNRVFVAIQRPWILHRTDATIRPSFNLIHWQTGFKIDVFIPAPGRLKTPSFAEFQRRVVEALVADPEQTAYGASRILSWRN